MGSKLYWCVSMMFCNEACVNKIHVSGIAVVQWPYLMYLWKNTVQKTFRILRYGRIGTTHFSFG